MNRAKVIAVAVLLLVSLIIVVQNKESVECKILFFSVTAPRAVLLFVMFTAGCVVGMLLAGRLLRRPPSGDA